MSDTFEQLIQQIQAKLTSEDFTRGKQGALAEAMSGDEGRVGELLGAEQIATHALSRFPGNSYLHLLRARARLLLDFAESASTENELILSLARDGGGDLEAAIRLTPDYATPRILLAYHTLNYLDDAADAVTQFAEVASSLEGQLCDAVAGKIKAMSETDYYTARSELERWQLRFPGSKELEDAALTVARREPEGS